MVWRACSFHQCGLGLNLHLMPHRLVGSLLTLRRFPSIITTPIWPKIMQYINARMQKVRFCCDRFYCDSVSFQFLSVNYKSTFLLA